MNLKKNITWQYEQSNSLIKLISSKDTWYVANATNFWGSWFNNVFNLTSANDFGVSIWARILGAPLAIFLPLDGSTPFGFGDKNQNFWYSNFSAAQAPIGLTLEEKKQVLRLLYYSQTLNNSIQSINYALKDVFGSLGMCYVIESGVMQLTYNIGYAMSDGLKTVLEAYNVLPRPGGVGFTINIV
jgi:Protein of unknown function (DUF2612)